VKITAEQLESFASKSLAKDLLPELMRRLVRASGTRIEDIYFPSGESTFRPGADGLVKAEGVPPYIPSGVSLWELSTDRDPHAKGRRDFEKRSDTEAKDDYQGTHRADITYVAVSLRRWNTIKGVDRDALQTQQDQLGVWKGVKILDAEHLEDWLDQCPSVSAWLGRRMGHVSQDMKSLEDFWEDYRTGVTPAMTPELLLLNRDSNAQTLIEAATQRQFCRVKADSAREAAAFVAATILSMPEDDQRKASLLAKGVVITRIESEHYLTTVPHLVIALEGATEFATQLAARGHTVVAAYGNSHNSLGNNSPLISLRRPRREEFIQALKALKLGDEEARRVADECHCNITVLYRTRDLSHARRPAWANRTQLTKLLGVILAGAYRHVSDVDKGIVSVLGDIEEPILRQHILDVLKMDDAPVRREGDLTALSAPADIWQLALENSVIDSSALERFRAAALTVLGERDPALDLPPEKRMYAALEGKAWQHSDSLRRGITEVLRLIAANAAHLEKIEGGFLAQQFVNDILREVPGLASDYQALASLDSLLPDLAEAAPDPFLSALEKLSTGDGSMLSPIFEGSNDTIFGRTYYLGMIKALEVLAWEPASLIRVSLLLARLAELDPGGHLSNRPINSLVHVFLPWRPQTNASQAARHAAIGKICQSHPDIAWPFLSRLLPSGHAISFSAAEPQWREMGASQRPTPTYGSYQTDTDFIVQLAIPVAGVEPHRWMKLLDAAISRHDGDLFGRLLAAIQERALLFREAQQDKLLWELMSSLISKHRAFETAAWAMPKSMLGPLEKLTSDFEPLDPISLHRHLFNSSIIEGLNEKETFEERRQRGDRQRDAALAQIAELGDEAIKELARQVTSPGMLAPSIVRTLGAERAADFVLGAFSESEPLTWVARQVMGYGSHRFGMAWGAHTLERVKMAGATDDEVASLLTMWDDTAEFFEFVNSLSPTVRGRYWATRDVFVRSDDKALVEAAVQKMLGSCRAIDLIPFVGGRLINHKTPQLMEIVGQAFDEVMEHPQKLQHLDTYWLREIFSGLRERGDVDRDSLMALEYRWLPALHSYGDRQEFALHDFLAEEPEFFVQVLSDVYRAENEEPPAEPSNEEEQAQATQRRNKAQVAHTLLESWQTLPGLDADGVLDAELLLKWIERVLALSEEVGRRVVAELEIGKVLAYAPDDEEDGQWPSKAVRKVIEALASPDVERGVVNELFNKRGVHSRPLEGGGDPERVLASHAKAASDALQANWPRTAQMLARNAEQWLYHAVLEDQRAAEDQIDL